MLVAAPASHHDPEEIAVLVLLALLALVGAAASVATVHAVVTDGYGSVPTRR